MRRQPHGCSPFEERHCKRRHFILLGAAGAAIALQAPSSHAAVAASGSAAATRPGVAKRRLLVLGDSLSAEYGLRRGSGWVALAEQRLRSELPGTEVINASLSGDTTSGGRARLGTLLAQHRPSHVVIELGGNDALRGLPLEMTRANLIAMVQQAKAAGARVMIIGMQVPPNYGPGYTRDFQALFVQVAKQESTALLPFLLAGVADDADPLRWFQADRIHPNEAAHPRILAHVWPVLLPWLRQTGMKG
ncbi:MAG TPA: arylesterase [Burkholderiaceae bacterium]|nr:arylesterase [Burkholderiaceae bacterium]HNG78832.1 arylesterase [Burkholderiaceae bacterium]